MDITKLKKDELIKYIEAKIANFQLTKDAMVESINYYNYEQDILLKKRCTIGTDGAIKTIENLPNARIIDNQYKKAVDQKVNYLFSQLPSIKCEDEKYQEMVQDIYDNRFLRTLNKIALESYLCGISWMYVANDGGKLSMMKMDSTEIIPIWSDRNHESIEAVIRVYQTEEYKDGAIKMVDKVALYTKDDVKIYLRDKDYTEIKEEGYLEKDGLRYSFDKVPFVYFKSNSSEMPLLKRVKSLQDAINSILSNYYDNMLEDPRNSIIILKNYDGEDLGEFRQKLAQYGAVKVSTGVDGADGDVETLEVQVNSENYRLILDLLKEKLIENAMAFDMKQDKTGNAPNELNIKSAYSDMELDANQTALEFTASLEHLEGFLKQIKGIKDDSLVTTTEFRRNLMINDEATVNMINQSEGLLSKKTLLSHHPFVDNVDEELRALEEEDEEEMGDYVDGGEDEEAGLLQ